MSIKISQVRHFVVLSEELSYSKASRRLNMAQSPLSQSIRRLEETLQAILFERSTHEVGLTAAGQAFIPHARRMLQQMDFARRLVRLAENPLGHQIVVGAASWDLNSRAPKLLEALGRHCTTRVSLKQCAGEALLEHLLDGRADITILSPTQLDAHEIEFRAIERSPLVAAIPNGWPVSDVKQITLRELAPLPLILFPPSHDPSLYHLILEGFHAIRHAPQIWHEASSVAARLKLVGAGFGVSLVPADAVSRSAEGVTFKVVSGLPVSLRVEVGLAWNAATPRARKDVFRAVANELSW